MDGWTLGIILFDLLALGALWRVRRASRALPAPRDAQPRDHARARRHLQEAADVLGLEVRQRGLSASLHGERDGAWVEVKPLGLVFAPSDEAHMDLSVVVHDPRRFDGGVFLLPRDPEPRHGEGALSGEDLGDPVFDQVFATIGDDAATRARLSAEHRRTIVALPGRISLAGERLTYSARALFVGPDAIVTAVEQALRAARALARPAQPDVTLAAVVTQDPDAGMRAGALTALSRAHPRSPALEPTARAALEDADPKVRLLAARALRAEAAQTIEALALGPHPDEIRADAFGLALSALPEERAVRLLAELLAAPVPPSLAIGLIQRAARAELDGAAGLLVRHLPSARPPLAVAVISALGDLADPDAEPALAAHLGDVWGSVRAAAAGALGAMGSPAALEALQRRLATERDAQVEARLRWAIDQIRARHEIDGGRLSLAAHAGAGAVSVGDDPGALALAPYEGPDAP